MRINVASGSAFSLCLTIVMLMVLLSFSDEAYAKRGCSAFGHSCFGGHGKRFDPLVARLQASDTMAERNSQDPEVPSPNDELFVVLPNDKFRERLDQLLMRTRQDTRRFDPYTLSFFVDQWLTSHRRPHRADLEITSN